MSPIFYSSSKSTGYFFCKGGSTLQEMQKPAILRFPEKNKCRIINNSYVLYYYSYSSTGHFLCNGRGYWDGSFESDCILNFSYLLHWLLRASWMAVSCELCIGTETLEIDSLTMNGSGQPVGSCRMWCGTAYPNPCRSFRRGRWKWSIPRLERAAGSRNTIQSTLEWW